MDANVVVAHKNGDGSDTDVSTNGYGPINGEPTDWEVALRRILREELDAHRAVAAR